MIAQPPGARPAGDAPPLRLPDPRLLFEDRAARLETLSRGHAARDWLAFLSRLAAGQAIAVRQVEARRPPARPGGPPLERDRIPGDEAWRATLRAIAAAVPAEALPAEARDALHRVSTLPAAELDALAGAVLAGRVGQDRAALSVFAGAAIQVWLAARASALDPGEVAGAQGACPVCGGAPVAGVVQAGTRLRYVTCALCAAEWYVARAKCVLCASEQVEYLHAEGAPQGAPGTEAASPRGSILDRGAKAEACRSCRTYLKLFDEEHRPGADAAADDAATIALDLLLADEGYRRSGPNLYVGAGTCDLE